MSQMKKNVTRRDFVKTAAAASTVIAMPMYVPSRAFGANDRIGLGFIGTGSRGMSHVNGLTSAVGVHALACCDVDEKHLARGKKTVDDKNKRTGRGGTADTYKEYEKLLERKDIDIVVITVPDHWHTKIAVEAALAGKDIYCEKPLTLTIDEGKILTGVVKKTKRVFQVGTQQRSGKHFVSTVAAVQKGLIGKVKRVIVSIGGGPKGGPFKVEDPPANLDWERWQGQTKVRPYRAKRCHYQFRWWYEYSGGKMTDWGAHHVDIAQWGIGATDTGPISVEPISVEHPVPFAKGYPTQDDSYNTATKFQTKAVFADGVEMIIRNDGHDGYKDPKLKRQRGNGVFFEGTDDAIFVNRGGGSGKLDSNGQKPDVNDDDLAKVYKGKEFNHYANFLACVRARREPVSDVWSHHRILSTCHLANIANRLGRKLNWDPKKEMVVGDEEGNSFVKREQRKGYEIKA
jgi:predicted dehydrogenase